MKLTDPLPQTFAFSFSKVCLILSGIVLFLSFFMLSVSGGYWPAYFVTIALALVPLGWGSHRQRLVAVVLCSVSLVLTVMDLQAGMRVQKRFIEVSWRAKMHSLEGQVEELRRELEQLRQERGEK